MLIFAFAARSCQPRHGADMHTYLPIPGYLEWAVVAAYKKA
jgi:hypothetical protein